MQVIGNYTLGLTIGDSPLIVQPNMMQYLKVGMSIEHLLPHFSTSLIDATHLLSDILPFDRNSNDIKIQFCRDNDVSNLNGFEFEVKSRKMLSGEVYSISGLLNVPDISMTSRAKAHTGSVRSTLESIAIDNWGVDEVEVGASLEYNKTLVQPHWSDAKFIMYLVNNLIGRGGESGYYAFIKNLRGKKIFVFKSIKELFLQSPKYKFIVSHRAYEDFIPVQEYSVIDYSSLLSDFSAKAQPSGYFDYETGAYITAKEELSECDSLSEFYLVDGEKETEKRIGGILGRSNEFTTNFQGRVRNTFYRKSSEMIHMYMTTWGLENISPGDIVEVRFANTDTADGSLMSQHSGYWLVKKVYHVLKNTFNTTLVLCRAGVDTDIGTTLVESEKRKL